MCPFVTPLLEVSGDGGSIEINGDEETEPFRMANGPESPSVAGVDLHERMHEPYRDWRKWCNMDRGRGMLHTHSRGSAVPAVGVAYFFITGEGVNKRKDLPHPAGDDGEAELLEARRDGKITKCLVIRCFNTKSIFGHVVPVKGADEEDYAAGLVTTAVLWLGHLEVIMKGDNEPALQALIERSMHLIRIKVADGAPGTSLKRLSKEEPAPYDSQSNGATEVGVMLIRGLFRTLKLCLESQIERYIPVGHAVIAWLLEHTCLLLNVRSRGSDGLTAWERVRGRPFGQQSLGFGETILYKLPVKGPRSQPDGNMGATQAEGTFVGYSRNANTFVVMTDEGKVEAHSLVRRPEPNRWSADKLAAIKSTPWSFREKPEAAVRFDQPAAESAEPPAAVRPGAPKEFRINQSDILQHGYTDRCAQCTYIEKYGRARAGGRHTSVCRKRIIHAICQSAVGKKRVADYEERLGRAMVEYSSPDQVESASAPVPPRAEYGEIIGSKRRVLGEEGDGRTPPRGVSGGMALPAEELLPGEAHGSFDPGQPTKGRAIGVLASDKPGFSIFHEKLTEGFGFKFDQFGRGDEYCH